MVLLFSVIVKNIELTIQDSHEKITLKEVIANV